MGGEGLFPVFSMEVDFSWLAWGLLAIVGSPGLQNLAKPTLPLYSAMIDVTFEKGPSVSFLSFLIRPLTNFFSFNWWGFLSSSGQKSMVQRPCLRVSAIPDLLVPVQALLDSLNVYLFSNPCCIYFRGFPTRQSLLGNS